MNEGQNTDIDQAKAALHLARAYHAGAMLAARHRPEDLTIQRRVQDAAQQGRGAWLAFQKAATVELAAQIQHIVPTEFQQ